jgi:hypothetical protein
MLARTAGKVIVSAVIFASARKSGEHSMIRLAAAQTLAWL